LGPLDIKRNPLNGVAITKWGMHQLFMPEMIGVSIFDSP